MAKGTTEEAPPKARRLSGDAILSISDRVYEDVIVPEWKIDGVPALVTVRSMTGYERDQLESTIIGTRTTDRNLNLRNMRAKMVAVTAVDSNPNDTPEREPKLLWAPDQVASLGRKNAAAVSRLYDVAARLAGMSDSDVKELTKELGNDESDGSGSN